MASSSAVLFLLLGVFAAGASAATFNFRNNCGMTIWPAGVPVGGGFTLGKGGSVGVDVPAGTQAGRFWARTGCSFNGSTGSCQTGDCNGQLSCSLSGKPPATLAEYSLGSTQDFYDISIVDGFNIGMAFSCSTGAALLCGDANCGPPQAYRKPNDDTATHACSGNSDYQITFCPLSLITYTSNRE